MRSAPYGNRVEWLEIRALGKTIACDTYRSNHPPTLISGQPPHAPVVSWQSPPDSGNGDLFEGILQALKYQLSRGTLSEIRSRVYRILSGECQII